MKKKAIILSGLLFLAAAIYLCTYTVNEREWVIVTEFGKPVRIIKDAGLHVKAPGFIHKVNNFDRRTQLFEIPPVQLLLSDKNPIIASCYVAWRILDPLIFFQSLGKLEDAKQKLSDMINSQLVITLGDYGIGNVINTDQGEVKLEELENKIRENSLTNAREQYGVEIIKVGIQRLAYPQVVVSAVLQRMKSERNKEAAKLRAEGDEQAAIIEAEADREASAIVSEAEKQALLLRGAADGEAMRLYGETYGRDPRFFAFIKSMEMYKKILDDQTTLILSTDSGLLKYLDFNNINR
jgi:modulator of FtsH protease HflC